MSYYLIDFLIAGCFPAIFIAYIVVGVITAARLYVNDHFDGRVQPARAYLLAVLWTPVGLVVVLWDEISARWR